MFCKLYSDKSKGRRRGGDTTPRVQASGALYSFIDLPLSPGVYELDGLLRREAAGETRK